MNRSTISACCAAFVFVLPTTTVAHGGDTKYDLTYKFSTGDVIRYEVEHRMSIRNTIDKETQQATSETKSVKAWRILDVLPDGQIELMNMVEKVYMKNQLPDLDDQIYDSTKDKIPPPGFEDAAKAVGVPISTLWISPQGKIVDRKMQIHQPAADPDALVTIQLPEEPVAINATWDEPLRVTVQLKEGGTRAIQARRHYKLTDVNNDVATIEVSYQILSPITAYLEAQLIQRFMNGTVRFDIAAGRILSQEMEVDRRVLGYAGPTSSMHYVMQMKERLLEDFPEVAQKP
jgi:urease beta subunit